MMRLAREAEELGYRSLWLPEVSGPDVFTTLAAYASVTSRVTLGSGVIPIQTRTPPTLAMSFASLHALSQGRAVIGLGVSSRIMVEQWHGGRFPPPLQAMRDCVAIIREILQKQKAQHHGKVYAARGFRLSPPLPDERPIPIYLAALNPEMLRLAGEIADGVLLNYTPPEAVPSMIAGVRRAAEAAGRNPHAIDLAIYIRCCVTQEEPPAVEAFQRELSSYGFVPPYLRMFARYGLADEFAEFQKLWREGKRSEAGHCFSEHSVRKLAALGSADRAADFIRRFRDAGITHPILFPIGPSATARAHFPETIRTLARA